MFSTSNHIRRVRRRNFTLTRWRSTRDSTLRNLTVGFWRISNPTGGSPLYHFPVSHRDDIMISSQISAGRMKMAKSSLSHGIPPCLAVFRLPQLTSRSKPKFAVGSIPCSRFGGVKQSWRRLLDFLTTRQSPPPNEGDLDDWVAATGYPQGATDRQIVLSRE